MNLTVLNILFVMVVGYISYSYKTYTFPYIANTTENEKYNNNLKIILSIFILVSLVSVIYFNYQNYQNSKKDNVFPQDLNLDEDYDHL